MMTTKRERLTWAGIFLLAWAILCAIVYWFGTVTTQVLVGGVLVLNGIAPAETMAAIPSFEQTWWFIGMVVSLGLIGAAMTYWQVLPLGMPLYDVPPPPPYVPPPYRSPQAEIAATTISLAALRRAMKEMEEAPYPEPMIAAVPDTSLFWTLPEAEQRAELSRHGFRSAVKVGRIPTT